MVPKEQTSGIALLVRWANEQDHWVRALVGAVLDTRRALGDEVIQELYELLLQEKGLRGADDGQPVSVPQIEQADENGEQEKTLRLSKLSGVTNVNALAAEQDINFNARLTVLYGENGAGKTGYVRILKRLASVRTAEAILPNIVSGKVFGPPAASIEYELGSAANSYTWAGEEGVAPFTQIDVFDSQGADLHVDGELTYIYTPTDLAVFRYTHDGIEAVKAKLESAGKDAQPSGNPFLNKFSREGTLYPKIEVLGATTDLPELERLGTVTDEERGLLAPLQDRVNALRSGTSDAKLQVAEAEQELFKRVEGALTLARGFDQGAYGSALESVRAAEKAHTHATYEALASEAIPGVLGDTWRALIEAAEAYLKEHKAGGYPQEGDTCPYCLQGLGEAAIAVVQKYRAFSQSDLQEALEKARTKINALTAPVRAAALKPLADDIGKRIGAVGEGDDGLLAARTFTAEFQVVQEAIGRSNDFDAAALAAKLAASQPLVSTRLRDLEALVKGLRADVAERKALLTSESTKLRQLQDRVTLSELLPSIRDHVASAKWASRAKTIIDRFRSVGRSLTETSKQASEQLLNHDFEATFTAECKALRAPPVTLDFPGRRGQPARRKSLSPQHRLSAILSEGEQKVIALADFIAEATLRRSATPLVLDDPVTSLDYKRLQHVVDRLVELSETRQVVVFTHNIWFTMELLARFDKNRKACTYYDISEDGAARGLVSAGESPRLDTWKDK
ncbi:MAG: AAA family ATPase, partial [Vicinamibacterales bacterium]